MQNFYRMCNIKCMYRKAIEYLKEWSARKNRKPLIIKGARQTGKTYLVRHFCTEHSFTLVEINFEENPGYRDFFISNDPVKIIQLIEIKVNQSIDIEKTILFLDEIQSAPEIFPTLRYFHEKLPRLRVITAGSLLEFLLEEHTFSMPVGRVEYLFLGPMTFEEFLKAGNRYKLYEFLLDYSIGQEMPVSIHNELISIFKQFLITGGMPEVIDTFMRTNSFRQCDIIKQSIISTYQEDFNKYGKKTDTYLLQKIFQKFPLLIGKKIIYAHIDNEEKSKNMEKALHMLELAHVIFRVYHTAANGIPPGAEINYKYAKAIFLDVGLLCRLLGLSLVDFENANDLILINSGAICEQFIGQHLLYLNDFYRKPDLYCWMREKSQSSAEVDYIISHGTSIIPIEIKAGKTGSLKSLQVFLQEKKYNLAVRFNTDLPSLLATGTSIPGPEQKFKLLSLPLYLVEQINRILGEIR